jgi:hypothetical protein
MAGKRPAGVTSLCSPHTDAEMVILRDQVDGHLCFMGREDGTRFELVGYAGGAAPEGPYGSVMCQYTAPDGTISIWRYQRVETP